MLFILSLCGFTGNVCYLGLFLFCSSTFLISRPWFRHWQWRLNSFRLLPVKIWGKLFWKFNDLYSFHVFFYSLHTCSLNFSKSLTSLPLGVNLLLFHFQISTYFRTSFYPGSTSLPLITEICFYSLTQQNIHQSDFHLFQPVREKKTNTGPHIYFKVKIRWGCELSLECISGIIFNDFFLLKIFTF